MIIPESKFVNAQTEKLSQVCAECSYDIREGGGGVEKLK